MKNKILPFSLIIIFVFIFIIFFKGLKETNIYTPKTKINSDLPKFSAKLFYSGKIVNSLDIFKPNKFYLLNIWSSWCVPCKQEHPLLMELSKDTEVVGINYKDIKKNAEKFLYELGNPYQKIILDKEGTVAIELGAYGIPETFLIYNDKVLKKYVGPLNKETFKEIKSFIK
tara:strand:+ start:1172 stop:1684 length:513 start_codon:yes stop_codon:yes gene_type:complete